MTGLPVETKYGTIYMNILPKFVKQHADMSFEKEFLSVIENEDYDIFIDVGAAWGYFSIPASHYCETVYAYEPQPSRLETLKKNITSLKRYNILYSSRGVGTGDVELFINHGSRGMVGPKQGKRNESVVVDWVSLRDILINNEWEKVLVKVDVEGAELDVIKSAGRLEGWPNVTWLIERHEKKDYGCSEDNLLKAMRPFKGTLVGARSWTSHYIFRMEE